VCIVGQHWKKKGIVVGSATGGFPLQNLSNNKKREGWDKEKKEVENVRKWPRTRTKKKGNVAKKLTKKDGGFIQVKNKTQGNKKKVWPALRENFRRGGRSENSNGGGGSYRQRKRGGKRG